MILNTYRYYIVILVTSLVAHCLTFITLRQIFDLNLLYLLQTQKKTEISPIEWETISPEKLKKYKTLGVKNGNKDFSVPTNSEKAVKDMKNSDLSKQIVKRKKKNKPSKNKKEEQDFVSDIKKFENSPNSFVSIRSGKSTGLHKEAIKKFASQRDDAYALKVTEFNLQYEPPEGVSMDELNSVEKMFYSFNKRAYESLISSFVRSFNRMKLRRPSIRQELLNENHNLTGRITFDREGNILAIKIIRVSSNDIVQTLFQNILEGVGKIHNPPKDLLKQSGQFNMYFSLKTKK
jgi:hypothetical protein